MGKTEEITPPVAAREVAAPPRIDERYRIEKEIGRGGMGRVFVAHDRKLGRDVAIKMLPSGGIRGTTGILDLINTSSVKRRHQRVPPLHNCTAPMVGLSERHASGAIEVLWRNTPSATTARSSTA